MKTLTIVDAKSIVTQYPIKGTVTKFVPYGEGHINETYLVTIQNNNKSTSYILQVMNNKVFPSIEKLMSNYVSVTKFAHKEIVKRKGNPHRETINVVFTKKNKSFYKYKDKYIRILEYIDNALALQVIEKPKDFYYASIAFANFYKMLAKFDASKLYEIIPNFHNTEKRYQNFLKALKEDKMKRAKTCQKEIKFIKDRAHYYPQLVNMLKKKQIPLRVTHNDTKLNNILFDIKTHRPVAVIDLDTIMPGSLCYDFGDAIRFGCNSSREDEKNLTKVHFRFDLYKLFLKGFLEILNKTITKKEKENLALGSIMMTIECGMRFLTDYLEGDYYFHTNYANHNLVRARTQLKLVKEMEEAFDKMNALIK
ncbi:MAG: aminoglycoside phosphotransferase family protein [Bacilli bacterium]|nr:aminoglycoside phosphotransferase family protein [Bacilli bacterium]